jgi:hypothetical protein
MSALFRGLCDDAAIFPPGNAPLEEAVVAHRAWRGPRGAGMVGTFICGAARLEDLVALGAEFPVSVTAPEGPLGVSAVLATDDLNIVSIEVPFAGEGWDDLLAAAAHTTVYVEVALADLTPELARRLVDAGLRLKLRAGGTEAARFPSAATLAEGIVTAGAAGLPFKLTAGLHHAVRHRDADTGFEHHGFGNVLAATAAVEQGASVTEVAAVLETTDPAAIASWLQQLSDTEAAVVRSRFVSFGTCSITEPLDDLAALGLLPVTTGADA